MAQNQHSAGRAAARPTRQRVTRFPCVLAVGWPCAATGNLANAAQPWQARRANRLVGVHGRPWSDIVADAQEFTTIARNALSLGRPAPAISLFEGVGSPQTVQHAAWRLASAPSNER